MSRATLAEKRHRAERANQLIHTIATCGRRFFSQDADELQPRENPRLSRLEIDDHGRIWFIDGYTEKRIYTAYAYRWRGFSGGGTLRSLVNALRSYIQTGKRLHAYHFGPWPKSLCDGDLWGYGEDMQLVRDAAARLEIVDA